MLKESGLRGARLRPCVRSAAARVLERGVALDLGQDLVLPPAPRQRESCVPSAPAVAGDRPAGRGGLSARRQRPTDRSPASSRAAPHRVTSASTASSPREKDWAWADPAAPVGGETPPAASLRRVLSFRQGNSQVLTSPGPGVDRARPGPPGPGTGPPPREKEASASSSPSPPTSPS